MALPDVENVNGDDGAGVGESEVMSRANVLAAFTESAEIRALIGTLGELHEEDCAAQESTMQRFMGENLLQLLYHLIIVILIVWA